MRSILSLAFFLLLGCGGSPEPAPAAPAEPAPAPEPAPQPRAAATAGDEEEPEPATLTGCQADVDPRAAAAELQRHGTELRYCYERALVDTPSLTVDAVLQVRLDMEGAITRTTINGDLPDSMRACLGRVAQALRIPAPTGGRGPGDCAIVSAPLQFRPNESPPEDDAATHDG